jgi:RNA polymerase sigma factor (sigma-70 family)
MPEQSSDAILLERFVSFREEAAFVALVERYGPLVQRVCRRVLRDEHDVDDVFQATFLVLARRAGGIAWSESVGGWLGAVAHRLALGTRSDLSRQHRRETSLSTLAGKQASSGLNVAEGGLPEELHPFADPFAEMERKELSRLVSDELRRLPEKYRSPIELCYFEGHTHAEAARQLGYPAGSISRRLKRAGALLRRRLSHRGFTFAIGFVAAGFMVFSICKSGGNPGVTAASVRSAMASLEPPHGGATEMRMQALLDEIERSGADRSEREIAAFARRATQVADEIEPYSPGRLPDEWRRFSAEMRQSAVLLAQATQTNDQASMLGAARRLNAACLGCHETFH